jgi:hypothetical protein
MMIFFFMSILASVSQARMTEVRRLSDMPLTTYRVRISMGRPDSDGWLVWLPTLANVFALSAVSQLVGWPFSLT